MEFELVGGPFDGARIRSGLRLPLLWTNGKRCFRKPSRRRSLYRQSETPGPVYIEFSGEVTRVCMYRFIGHTHVMCECGAVRVKHRKCPMCGEAPVTDRA